MSTFHHKATITVYIMRDSSSNTLKQKEIEVGIDLSRSRTFNSLGNRQSNTVESQED